MNTFWTNQTQQTNAHINVLMTYLCRNENPASAPNPLDRSSSKGVEQLDISMIVSECILCWFRNAFLRHNMIYAHCHRSPRLGTDCGRMLRIPNNKCDPHYCICWFIDRKWWGDHLPVAGAQSQQQTDTRMSAGTTQCATPDDDHDNDDDECDDAGDGSARDTRHSCGIGIIMRPCRLQMRLMIFIVCGSRFWLCAPHRYVRSLPPGRAERTKHLDMGTRTCTHAWRPVMFTRSGGFMRHENDPFLMLLDVGESVHLLGLLRSIDNIFRLQHNRWDEHIMWNELDTSWNLLLDTCSYFSKLCSWADCRSHRHERQNWRQKEGTLPLYNTSTNMRNRVSWFNSSCI